MKVADYLKTQVQDLFKNKPAERLQVYMNSLASRFPSSTLYYNRHILSSEQLANQVNSQAQDLLALQYQLTDMLKDADSLTEQINKFIDQVYYTSKYSLHSKRQAEILRFMPSIEDMQILSPVHTYYTKGYVQLTDQLVAYPTDGGLVKIAGFEFPAGIDALYSQMDEAQKIVYAGVSETEEYNVTVVLPIQVQVQRIYVLDKLGMFSLKSVSWANGSAEPQLSDYVWYADVNATTDSLHLTLKQHVLEPYTLTSILKSIFTKEEYTELKEERMTGIPVVGQIDVQVCYGTSYTGYQVYKSLQDFELVFGLRSYTADGQILMTTDQIINEPIILAR